mmetsp:Transcript_97089/g.274577  ORF Transcript_97089/g.274577 Transcript_97089/m.274577 type:complete len:227 (+) Transcript_97089:257-937(+)
MAHVPVPQLKLQRVALRDLAHPMRLRQHVEHVVRVACNAVYATLVRVLADAGPGPVAEDAEPDLAAGAHGVLREHPHVAHEELVREGLVQQRLADRGLLAGPPEGPRVPVQDALVLRRVDRHAQQGLGDERKVRDDAISLVHGRSHQYGNLVPLPLSDQLARLPEDGLIVDDRVPARFRKGLAEAEVLLQRGELNEPLEVVIKLVFYEGPCQVLADPVLLLERLCA